MLKQTYRERQAQKLRKNYSGRDRLAYVVYGNGNNYELSEAISQLKLRPEEVLTNDELINHINSTRSESMTKVQIKDPHLRTAIDNRGLREKLGRKYLFPTLKVYQPIGIIRYNRRITMFRSPRQIQKY